MTTKTMTIDEMYEQIKADLKIWQKKRGIKLSITRSSYDCFNVAIMRSTEKMANEDYFSINHYYIENDHRLTDIGVLYAKEIKDIVFTNHWDESDSMTDYFNAAFYFRFSLGKYDKPYQIIEPNKRRKDDSNGKDTTL